MALITAFRYRSDRTIRYRTQLECGWTYDRSQEPSERVLQLETYASDGTTSQVMQVDRTRAEELLHILYEVFPALSSPT
jgi:hypothetical protein